MEVPPPPVVPEAHVDRQNRTEDMTKHLAAFLTRLKALNIALSVFYLFCLFLQYTAMISVDDLNQFVFVMEIRYVFCEEGTGYSV